MVAESVSCLLITKEWARLFSPSNKDSEYDHVKDRLYCGCKRRSIRSAMNVRKFGNERK